MVIDFEHHLQPYEIWKKRGGKPGQTVLMRTYIEKIRKLDIDKKSIQAMLSGNGIELLGLTPS